MGKRMRSTLRKVALTIILIAALGGASLGAEGRKPYRHAAVVVDTVGFILPTFMGNFFACAELQFAFLPGLALDADVGLKMLLGTYGPSFDTFASLGLRTMFAQRGLSGFYLRGAGGLTIHDLIPMVELSLGYEYQAAYGLVVDSRVSAWYVLGGYIIPKFDILRLGWAF
jgi:hypothetical protein